MTLVGGGCFVGANSLAALAQTYALLRSLPLLAPDSPGSGMSSRFRLSRRDLAAFLSDLLDVPAPSLGSTAAFAKQASRALLPTQREVRRAVRSSESADVDETGWKLRGRPGGWCR